MRRHAPLPHVPARSRDRRVTRLRIPREDWHRYHEDVAERLAERLARVGFYAARGVCHREIARILGCSMRTVERDHTWLRVSGQMPAGPGRAA